MRGRGGGLDRNFQGVTARHRLHIRGIAVIAGRKIFRIGGKLALFEGIENGDGPEVRAATNPITPGRDVHLLNSAVMLFWLFDIWVLVKRKESKFLMVLFYFSLALSFFGW